MIHQEIKPNMIVIRVVVIILVVCITMVGLLVWSLLDPRIMQTKQDSAHTGEGECIDCIDCIECFSNNKVRLGKSCLGDRGAFATQYIKAGEVVEVCPLVIEKRANVPYRSTIDDYVFSVDSSNVAVSFGYCSFFNHNDDNNVTWKLDANTKRMTIYALRDINAGDEMFVSYGANYWKSRGITPVSCTVT